MTTIFHDDFSPHLIWFNRSCIEEASNCFIPNTLCHLYFVLKIFDLKCTILSGLMLMKFCTWCFTNHYSPCSGKSEYLCSVVQIFSGHAIDNTAFYCRNILFLLFFIVFTIFGRASKRMKNENHFIATKTSVHAETFWWYYYN